ncbi:MAG: thioredoxin family protein [Candidatus Latescibacterota bacterium]|nr:MAG: thioredoxin family protein [Candidatus Latescibacterota bacterium]
MATIDLNSENFRSTVEKDGIVMVDCWASWCDACKPFEPIFEAVAAKHSRHTFGKIDTQSEKDLVSKLGIDHIPTLLLYRDGVLVFRQPGYFSEEQLEDIVRQAESLDMNEVRSHIASKQTGQQ